MAQKTIEGSLHEGQICYPAFGKMVCNFIVRYGKRINPKKEGGSITFPLGRRTQGKDFPKIDTKEKTLKMSV